MQEQLHICEQRLFANMKSYLSERVRRDHLTNTGAALAQQVPLKPTINHADFRVCARRHQDIMRAVLMLEDEPNVAWIAARPINGQTDKSVKAVMRK